MSEKNIIKLQQRNRSIGLARLSMALMELEASHIYFTNSKDELVASSISTIILDLQSIYSLVKSVYDITLNETESSG